jgi:hypothetical protein
MKYSSVKKRLFPLFGVLVIMGTLLMSVYIPQTANAAQTFNQTPDDDKQMNVWNGEPEDDGGGGDEYVNEPMFTKGVSCYPVLSKAPTNAQTVISDNNIPTGGTPTGGGGSTPGDSGPFDVLDSRPTSALDFGSKPTGTAASVYDAYKSSGHTGYIISFDSGNDSSSCQQAGLLVQASAGSRMFYGSILASQEGDGEITVNKYITFTATVNATNGTVTFTDPLQNYVNRFGSNGQQVGPPPAPAPAITALLNNFNVSDFSGSGTQPGPGTACPDEKFSEVDSDAQNASCVQKYESTANFTSLNTITFAGATFVSTHWGGGSNADFIMTDPGKNDPTWDKYGKSYIEFDWSIKDHGALSLTSPADLEQAIAWLSNSGNYINTSFHNVNINEHGTSSGGSSTPGGYETTLTVGGIGIKTVANYNPASKDISTVYTSGQGSGNESEVIGDYDVDATDNNTYLLQTGGSSSCQDNETPKFKLDFNPTDNPNLFIQGTLVPATWYVDIRDSCSFSAIPVYLLVGAPTQKSPTVPPPGSSTKNQQTPDQSCESGAGPLGWILCAVIDSLADAVNGTYTDLIVPMLQVSPLSDSSSNGKSIYEAWSSFRVFGNIFLVIVVLVVVFGESIGGGAIDAYSVKKILPRVLAAAIMINLSFYIVAVFLDFTNIIGNGLRLLITGAFGLQGNTFNLSSINGAAQAGLATGGFLGLSAAGIATTLAVAATSAGAVIITVLVWVFFSILIPLLLIMLAIMAVLAIRLGLIFALVLFSPVAFALWTLPNTEKYFKKWWELLQTTAMIYPIISGLFGLSMILAQTTIISTGSKGFLSGAIGYIVSLVIVIMPLALIPFSFKLAGGIIGRVHEFVDGARGQGMSKYKKWRDDPHTGPLGRRKRELAMGVTDFRKSLGDEGTADSAAGRGLRGRAKRALGGRYTGARQAAYNKEEREISDAENNDGDDTYRRASTLLHSYKDLRGTSRERRNEKTGVMEYQAGDGKWYNEAEIKEGGKRNTSRAAWQAAWRRTLEKSDSADPATQRNLLKDYTNYANEEGLSTKDAGGDWVAAALPFQHLAMDMRYADFSTDAAGHITAGLSDSSLLGKMGSEQGFRLAAQSEGTFESVATAYTRQADKLAASDRIVGPAGEGGKMTVEQRRKAAEELYNARENVRKYVGERGGTATPATPGTVTAPAPAPAAPFIPPTGAPPGATAGAGSTPGYGGATSASWKNEDAAKRALAQMDAYNVPFDETDTTYYSGGRNPNDDGSNPSGTAPTYRP